MRILIVGLSTRAIAESAVRGGYNVVTLDYFGDRDQRALVRNYALQRDFDLPFSPGALIEASDGLAFDAVAYTSSLENHPEVVEKLAQGRELLGNPLGVLRAVRDWARLRAVCDEEGIPYATTLLPGEETKADPTGRWLRKPVRSGGGHGIEPWSGGSLGEGYVLQEQVEGQPASAAFVADGKRSVLLGVSEQLIGREALGAHGYTWCGNILPLALRSGAGIEAIVQSLERTAARLTQRFNLRGVNGMDFVVADDAEGQVHPSLVEINPRYSASMELMDRAYGLSAFDLHVRSFDGELPAYSLAERLDDPRFCGKGIVYADENVVMPNTADWRREGRRDIPFSGERIEAGHPICTVVAEGESRAGCWQTLVRKAEDVRNTLIGDNL
ncbi:MAG: ATP-grasp domain-containing protein [Chloroflexota bacterium]